MSYSISAQFVEQSLRDFLLKGMSPDVAIQLVAQQLCTGDIDEDQRIKEVVQDAFDSMSYDDLLIAEKKMNFQLVHIGNRPFKIFS